MFLTLSCVYIIIDILILSHQIPKPWRRLYGHHSEWCFFVTVVQYIGNGFAKQRVRDLCPQNPFYLSVYLNFISSIFFFFLYCFLLFNFLLIAVTPTVPVLALLCLQLIWETRLKPRARRPAAICA